MNNYPFCRRPATPWKIGVGVLLLIAAVGTSRIPVSAGSAAALVALSARCTVIFGGIALDVAELPRTLRNPRFVKQRLPSSPLSTGRRRLLKDIGGEFLLIALIAVDGGILVTALCWFVWT
jgi:hypothetical protein